MRNSSSIWDETPRVGELCWCEVLRGIKYPGIVIDIYGFDYWNPQTKHEWIYIVWTNGHIIFAKGSKVEKM